MRRRLSLVRLSWSVVLFISFTGCSGTNEDDDDTSVGDDDDSSPATLQPYLELSQQVDQSTTEPGYYTIHYTLFGDEGSSFEVNGSYSTDGVTFIGIDSGGGEPTTGLSASPEGVAHSLIWASLEDLGFVTTDVWFRLSGKGGGYDLEPKTMRVAVNNVPFDKPCYITLTSPTVQDGDIPLTYTLSDVGGDRCNVSIRITLPGNTGSVAATASVMAPSDPLTDIVVPADADVTQTFVWDSLTDVGAVDEEVTIVVTAEDANHSQVDSFPILIENGPVPDPGEIIFTEVFFWPFYTSSTYLELYNTSRHTLSLQNTLLTSVYPSYYLVSPDKALNVLPGEYVVLAQVDFGTYPVDSTYGSEYIISNKTDVLTLLVGETVIDSVSYDRNDYGGSEMAGHSIALLPEFMNATANDALESWCVETTPLPLNADETEVETDYGSPGVATTCSAPESTPTPAPEE